MAKICKKKRSWHTYGGQREWSLWAVLPWISTRNPCPIPSKISSDEDVLVNVPTHLAIPDFTAQNIPSWPPHWPWRKVHVCTVLQTSLASCQVCMWAEGEQGVGFTLDLTMPAHHTILVQQLPFPEPSCHKLAYACETSCQGRWEKTVEQKWEVRSQCASCKRNLEEKQRSSCSSSDISEVHSVALSSLILTPRASRLLEGALLQQFFFTVPFFFPLSHAFHCTCTYTLFFCYQPQENCLLGFLEVFYIAQLF